MVKRTITITTILLIFTMVLGFIIVLNKSSFAAEDIASGTSGTCSWRVTGDGVLIIEPTDGVSGTLATNTIDFNTGYPWTSGQTGSFSSKIVGVRFEGVVKTPSVCRGLLSNLVNCTKIDLTNLDTSGSTDLQTMFYSCYSLTNIIGLSSLNVSNVTNMALMFDGCRSLTELDLSNWDMSKVTKLNSAVVRQTNAYQPRTGLFYQCTKLTTVKFPTSLNTSKMEDLSRMFVSCRSLKSVDLSILDTRKSNDMSMFFYECNQLSSVVLGKNFRFDGNNISDVSKKAIFPKIELGYNSVCTGKWIREDGKYGPYTAEELRDNYTPEMSGKWIREVKPCAVYTATGELDFVRPRNEYNTNNTITQTVTSISGIEVTGRIFNIDETSTKDNNRTWSSICYQAKKVVFIDEIKPKNTSQWFNSFNECTEMNLLKLNMSEVTNMNSMFNNCGKLKSLDVSSFDTSNVTSMDHTFNGCSSLTTMDVSNFDVSNVTTLSCLFNNCGKLKSVNVNGWDVSNVKAFNHMFNASSLETLDLSSFDTSNATYMEWMLAGATSLKSIVLGNNFVFKGKNISNINNQAILHTPSEIGYSGEWVREDKEVGPYTPAELRDNYDGINMAGKWVWAKAKYNVVYKYDGTIPNGASALPNNEEYEYETQVTIAKDASAPGYTFSGWNRTGTFEMPAEDVTIIGSFTANTDTPYIVEHYLEDITEGSYTLTKTDNLTGTTDTEVEATAKEYEGFTFDNTIEGTKQSGNIAGDGSLVLKIYYNRNSYNVTYAYTGDVPEDASKLPQSETYKYEEEIKVPEYATAEGYTFSGWIKDYINMPAKDIEITGYFIEEPRSYKIEYYFDNELDEALVEILNAEKGEEINLTPQTPVKHGEKNYTLVSNNHNITISVNDENNVIRVYYETDVLDYAIDNFEDTTEGDGIPDKYQISITYKVENGNWNDGSKGTKTDIITLKDKDGNLSEEGIGTTNIPEVGNKPSEGYEVGSWNEEIPIEVSNKDNGKEFVYSYKKSEKQNIEQKDTDITEASGKIYNPKTDDIVNKYLLVGIGGILVLALVRKIRRKYSRKAKKIQF